MGHTEGSVGVLVPAFAGTGREQDVDGSRRTTSRLTICTDQPCGWLIGALRPSRHTIAARSEHDPGPWVTYSSSSDLARRTAACSALVKVAMVCNGTH